MVTDTIAYETESDPHHFSTLAECRQSVRHALRFSPEGSSNRILTNAEARRLAYRAVAVLDTHDENGHLIGPYTTHAVAHVLRNVACGSADRDLVQQYAQLFNVAAWITV